MANICTHKFTDYNIGFLLFYHKKNSSIPYSKTFVDLPKRTSGKIKKKRKDGLKNFKKKREIS